MRLTGCRVEKGPSHGDSMSNGADTTSTVEFPGPTVQGTVRRETQLERRALESLSFSGEAGLFTARPQLIVSMQDPHKNPRSSIEALLPLG